jgi:hypothetical protein
MDRISRRQVVQGAAAATAVTTLRAPAVHAQNDLQTLRFVAQADLKILDPVWTTAYISAITAISCTTPSSALTQTLRSNRKWSTGPQCLRTA